MTPQFENRCARVTSITSIKLSVLGYAKFFEQMICPPVFLDLQPTHGLNSPYDLLIIPRCTVVGNPGGGVSYGLTPSSFEGGTWGCQKIQRGRTVLSCFIPLISTSFHLNISTLISFARLPNEPASFRPRPSWSLSTLPAGCQWLWSPFSWLPARSSSSSGFHLPATTWRSVIQSVKFA